MEFLKLLKSNLIVVSIATGTFSMIKAFTSFKDASSFVGEMYSKSPDITVTLIVGQNVPAREILKMVTISRD